jgi:hypothetical protein
MDGEVLFVLCFFLHSAAATRGGGAAQRNKSAVTHIIGADGPQEGGGGMKYIHTYMRSHTCVRIHVHCMRGVCVCV